jgi:hypothetical protein
MLRFTQLFSTVYFTNVIDAHTFVTEKEINCDRTTLEMRGLSPKIIIAGDSWQNENRQTHHIKYTIPYI